MTCLCFPSLELRALCVNSKVLIPCVTPALSNRCVCTSHPSPCDLCATQEWAGVSWLWLDHGFHQAGSDPGQDAHKIKQRSLIKERRNMTSPFLQHRSCSNLKLRGPQGCSSEKLRNQPNPGEKPKASTGTGQWGWSSRGSLLPFIPAQFLWPCKGTQR